MQGTFSNKIMFILSATPFCCGVSLTLNCLSIASLWHSHRKRLLVSSSPLSEWSILIFLLVFFSIFFFHSINNFRTFSLCLKVYTQHHLEKSSIKTIKQRLPPINVVLRGPQIFVNIIRNFLVAMNHGVKFHLGFLTDDTMHIKF